MHVRTTRRSGSNATDHLVKYTRLPLMASLGKSEPLSAVRDHDLPEMTAPLEMPIGFFRLCEREELVDDRAQAVHFDSAVHGREIGAASDADRTECDAATGEQ